MATTAQSRLREMLVRATGLYISDTTSGSGAGDGTTVVDTSIVRYDTTLLTDKWLLLTSGSASGESRRIASVSTSTITMVSAFSAQVAGSVTYEIMSYPPEIYHDAIRQATRTVYPLLYLPLRDETLAVDNLLSNFDFETFSGGAFTGWSSIGSPTLAAQTNRVMHGDQSASMAATGATEGLEQNILASSDFSSAVGKTLHVRAWLYATVADAFRMRVTFDGSTYSNGPYHGGDDEWEGPNLHRIDATIEANATEMTISFEATSGNTGYADLVVAWIDPVTRYTIPTTFISGPHRVSQQVDQLEPDGAYAPLGPGNFPMPGRLLRLEGMGRLSVPSADTGTTEVDENRAEMIIAQAGVYFYRTLGGYDPGSRDRHDQEVNRWQLDVERLKRQPGIAMAPMSSHSHAGFSFSGDSGNRYLVLDRRRWGGYEWQSSV